MVRNALVVAGLVAVCAGLMVPGANAGSRRERRQAAIEESAKPRTVAGAETFQVTVPYDQAYETVLNFLKRRDHAIESASKETGQIFTSLVITGGYRQTGTRVQAVLIKDSDAASTIKVAVTTQKRFKALQTEPWSDPKIDPEQSRALAEELKAALGGVPKSQ